MYFQIIVIKQVQSEIISSCIFGLQAALEDIC